MYERCRVAAVAAMVRVRDCRCLAQKIKIELENRSNLFALPMVLQETNRGVRQYTCVYIDPSKAGMLVDRSLEPGADWQRAVGEEVFAVPVISKLVRTVAASCDTTFAACHCCHCCVPWSSPLVASL